MSSSDTDLIKAEDERISFASQEKDEGSSSTGECIDSPDPIGCIDSPDPGGCIESPDPGGCIESPDPGGCIDSPDPGECIGSPDPVPEDTRDENLKVISVKVGKQFTSTTLEGELDFEDEKRDGSEGDEAHSSSENVLKTKCDTAEEGEDDGEISDEDDLEEGEVRGGESGESPAAKQPTRQVCRFFNRGVCTWGPLCRFLHLSVGDRGLYNMFAPANPRPGNIYGPPHTGNGNMGPSSNVLGSGAILNQRTSHTGSRGGPPPDFMAPIPPPLPPPPNDISPVETAWERGLRHAKELMKKANKRKEQEPDFENKRLNLGLDENIRAPASEYDKENEAHEKNSYRRQNEVQAYKYEGDVFDNGEREAREWRGGRYENFEIRYTRQDAHSKESREKDRSRQHSRISSEREKMSQRGRSEERWRERDEMQSTSRQRADVWRDPWRRSKSPKGRRSTSGGRGSYSSVSSYSYSDRSSRSSFSYSRSSSRSSFYSSRSPSPSQKRKLGPEKELGGELGVPKRPVPGMKRKALTHRSSSSRSVSPVTRTPISRSRSRTYSRSRSLSMDSVSSASSSISHSSSGSVSKKKINQHMSILRKDEENVQPIKSDSKPGTSLFEEMQRLKQAEALKEEKLEFPLKETFITPDATLHEKPIEEIMPYPSLRNILPASEKVLRDPVKYNLHKQQIKLTLLNRAIMTKSAFLPKKDIDVNKIIPPAIIDEPVTTIPAIPTGIKRPASPPPVVINKPGFALPLKKSTSSRRDELLKQLKAVEDAIARKRAKFI